MIIWLLGSLYGEFNTPIPYKKIPHSPNVILQVGNFGVYKKNKLPTTLNQPVFFIPGLKEDHVYMNDLYKKGILELAPKLYWMVSGLKFPIGGINVMGLGKVYSSNTWNNISLPKENKLRRRRIKKQLGHYTKGQVEKCCSQGEVDIFLCHQAGKGIKIGNVISESEGINEICEATKPKLMVHGFYDKSLIYKNPITNTLTVSLAKHEIKIIDFNKENKTIKFLN